VGEAAAVTTKALNDLANRWDAPDARFAVLDASVRAVYQQCARELRAALAQCARELRAALAEQRASAPVGRLLAELDEAIRIEDAEEDGPNEQIMEVLRRWRDTAEELVQRAAAAEARIAELEREAERAEAEVVMLRAGEELRVDAIKQNAALRARVAELEAAAVLLRERMQIACNSSALDRDARIWGAAIKLLDAALVGLDKGAR
jgi:hypothetical protein